MAKVIAPDGEIKPFEPAWAFELLAGELQGDARVPYLIYLCYFFTTLSEQSLTLERKNCAFKLKGDLAEGKDVQ